MMSFQGLTLIFFALHVTSLLRFAMGYVQSSSSPPTQEIPDTSSGPSTRGATFPPSFTPSPATTRQLGVAPGCTVPSVRGPTD